MCLLLASCCNCSPSNAKRAVIQESGYYLTTVTTPSGNTYMFDHHYNDNKLICTDTPHKNDPYVDSIKDAVQGGKIP